MRLTNLLICGLIISALSWSLTTANEPIVTIYEHPLPPIKYQGSARVIVKFTYDPNKDCSSLQPIAKGQFYVACYDTRNEIMYVPHPCADNRIDQEYSQLLCHELGHANGWSHG